MNFTWTHEPTWLVINSLVAYRITRLWIADALPPLPRIRKWVDSKAGWYSLQYGRLARFDQRHPGNLTEDQADQRDELVNQAERRIDIYGGEPALSYLATCYWCSGFWIAAAVTLAASTLPAALWAPIALPFALSAATGLIAGRTP